MTHFLLLYCISNYYYFYYYYTTIISTTIISLDYVNNSRRLVSAPGANYYNGCQTSNVWGRNMSRSRESRPREGQGNNRQKQPPQHAREL